jgi:hypothetical protein
MRSKRNNIILSIQNIIQGLGFIENLIKKFLFNFVNLKNVPMRCEGCLKQENLFMCFLTDRSKEIYYCAKCLAKALIEDPFPIYNMSKLGYSWKNPEIIKKRTS